MVSGYYKDKTRNGEVCRVLDNEGRHDCQINADVEFIAASRTDVPRLLAEVRHLRGALAADAHRLEAAAMRVGIIAGCDAPDEMADLIEFLRASRTWQPIETAPKDGTWVIIGGEGWSESGFYSADPEKNYWHETGWYTSYEDVSCRHPAEPTRWMPLPEPPEQAAMKNGGSLS